MPFAITIRRTFCAAHRLTFANGVVEPTHGHNWHVSLTVRRHDGQLDDADCVLDFHELEHQLDAVIGPWNNNNLNACPPFASGVNPSAERVAEAIATGIEVQKGVIVERVDVTEAEGCIATWRAA